jgi:hypothetical protein
MFSTFHLPSSPVSHGLRRRWLGTRPYWLCQLAGWSGLFIVFLIPQPFRSTPLLPNLIYSFAFSAAGIALTHLLRIVFLFHLRAEPSWWGAALRFTPWIVVAAAGHVIWLLWLAAQLPSDPATDLAYATQSPAAICVDNLTLSAPLFAIWTGFYIGIRYYRQYQLAQLERLKLDAAMKEAELRSLKAQINPHFLFNSLNTLRALIPRDLAPPREALTLLSDLLRATLTQGQEETIPFARELETVDNYLALERLRFEERLQVNRAVDPATLERPIPPFVLQTIVENAIKYGLNPREQGARISLEAALAGSFLRVRVCNPGTLENAPASTGVGLKNARARLRLLFGADARLHLRQLDAEHVEAELLVPPLPAISHR